jgi:hypothetical protein
VAAPGKLCGNKEYSINPVQTHELVHQGVQAALGHLSQRKHMRMGKIKYLNIKSFTIWHGKKNTNSHLLISGRMIVSVWNWISEIWLSFKIFAGQNSWQLPFSILGKL